MCACVGVICGVSSLVRIHPDVTGDTHVMGVCPPRRHIISPRPPARAPGDGECVIDIPALTGGAPFNSCATDARTDP